MAAKYNLLKVFSVIAILAMTFSNVQPARVEAQSGDGLKRQVNAESGRVSFITPADGKSLPAARALGQSIRPQDPAMALAAKYGPEFGLQNAERSLTIVDSSRADDGRVTVRFQQNYENVPVMGGELIVNTNDNGDLYSISGEVSPGISLSTTPAIDARRAQETALQAMAKWYQKTPEDFAASEPELWIYDESLLQHSTRPVELTWRMEITPKDGGMPVRELVLVNAQRGSVSLHFNQVDTAWSAAGDSNILYQNAEATGALLYVATTGNDSNSCDVPGSPCATINAAIGKAESGDTIQVAVGTYTGSGSEVVLLNKTVSLSGGWDPSFTSQTGYSTIDGGKIRRVILVNSTMVAALDHIKITNGQASDGGGGIRNEGNLLIKDSLIEGNEGGGIDNLGVLTVDRSSIKNNTTPGGAIHNNGSLTITSSTIDNNHSSGGGGGLTSFDGDVFISNTTINNNSAVDGAGIYIYYGNVNLRNVTINGNTATNYGGGINGVTGRVYMQNSILAGNTSSLSVYGPNCSAVVISNGYNLIGDGTGCAYSPAVGDQVGTTDNPIQPRLDTLKNNGGPTFTQALLKGSPAIDKGNPALPGGSSGACLAEDQRGIARPVGVRCDIGAYEGSISWTPSPRVETYNANHTSALPGSFVCNQADPGCAAGDAQAKAAHKYAMGVYDFYVSRYSRDSIDNNGMIIKSSVHYCGSPSDCPYDNAFWNDEQMVYGDKYAFPLADDVVAHELTHGVTQHESSLFYYYQSGAISESFSDLWGEYYDQSNSLGNDSADLRWIIGEDVSGFPIPAGFSVPAMRSMKNPPALGDPDKMTSSYYYKGDGDNGGVHYNSGINNKAVYLMVDGGTFNGKTVNVLGWEKVGIIYYEVNTSFLTSGADYSDLYYALQQACASLIGQNGIIAADCTEVKNAIDAVQMNSQPVANFNTDAPYCDNGSTPTILFSEDLEGGSDAVWEYSTPIGSNRWQLNSPYGPYAHSGVHMMYADDYPPERTATMAAVTLNSPYTPGIFIPPNAYLRFSHAFGFEDYNGTNFDGGVFKYRGTGTTFSDWKDGGSLFINNGYNGTIVSNYGNPIAGQKAFVKDSHGYITSRLNLATLANKYVVFGWEMNLDYYVSDWGWWLDDIEVYTCSVPTFADVPFNHPYHDDIEILYANGLTGGCATNPLKFCPDQIMNRGQAAVFILRANFGSSYVPPVATHIFKDDWSKGTWAEPWAEGMRKEGISAGCLANPLKYCPWDQIPREQAVIFALRMKYGTLYTPPPATGTLFADMTNPSYYATAWAEKAYTDGIITNCGTTGGKPNFCPKALVSRGLAAYMIVRAKGLTMP